jgi:hypothetical protein
VQHIIWWYGQAAGLHLRIMYGGTGITILIRMGRFGCLQMLAHLGLSMLRMISASKRMGYEIASYYKMVVKEREKYKNVK